MFENSYAEQGRKVTEPLICFLHITHGNTLISFTFTQPYSLLN
jgi:hypothetical protein